MAGPDPAPKEASARDVPPAHEPDPESGGPEKRPLGKPAHWPPEIGGPSGPEPTRYGDWERNGRVSDF